jgi:tRNA A-37 threonylcarbamoyl transferase component Bud32/outer membrane protein assembly factor BamB
MTEPDSQQTQPTAAGVPDATAAYQPHPQAEELVRVLDQYLADLEAGCAPPREKLLADHPDLASQLEPCLAGMEFIHSAARPAADASTHLGDFAIVREVGRGGMGVVYEAQQLSLKRKVALKVLRFAGVADREAMERFQREAETVALLHHTNIVPIFAIGEQKGVFYYAMQFIEGRSLAAVLEQSQKDATPLNLAEAARWALQAAEALAHAHQRNVIHRDVKPSNLILDPAGQVWLTDFGLAKRIDDANLSMTGGLLGTPRYMSPEQASAAKRPVDQRTDIYSLGATLYELATGKPLFEADSPYAIISQILTTEPPRPRSVRTGLPRDLETIILKCLAKEASGRYPTAQALADDLRAFCDGRPIKARRAGLPERAVRWMKTRKKNVSIAAMAVAATLVVAVVSYLVFGTITEARLAHFDVSSGSEEHFKVEVLDETEQKAIATFTAPTQQAQVIPPGKYHVRFSRAGQLSETSQFEAAVGSSYSAVAALSPRSLWEIPVANGESVELARLDGRDDLFLANNDVLRRLHGATGQAIWQISLAAKDQPLVEKAFHGTSYSWTFSRRNDAGLLQPGLRLDRPTLDLDGDGTPDLVWASRSAAALVALSGKTGKVLWCHRCPATLPENVREEEVQNRFKGGAIAGSVVGEPLLAETGGKKIVAALFAVGAELLATTRTGTWVRGHGQLWLEALDAETGQTLWRRRLDWTEQMLMSNVSYAAAIWQQNARTIGAIACERRLFGFEMLTGQPAWPDRELDATPLVVRFADLCGDGELGVLLLSDTPLKAEVGPNSSARAASTLFRLTALSPRLAAPLWERSLNGVAFPLQHDSGGMTSQDWDWPLVADLDGKGKPKIVVPFVDRDARACGVDVLNGATGETCWQKRLASARSNWRPPQPERMVLGPDLNGDGYREIFAVSYDQERERVYVDALSGHDGKLLWSNQQTTLGRSQPTILPLRWWQPGSDGWPLLVVSPGEQINFGGKARAIFLAASTGKSEHEATDIGTPEVFDVNGDGLPDLVFFDSNRGPSGEYRLRAIKGSPPVAWRLLGRLLTPAQDFNGDGTTDLLSADSSVAISGRDGTTLWNSDSQQFAEATSRGLPEADLNGDGVPDVLSAPTNSTARGQTANVVATSGRDGTRLWSSGTIFCDGYGAYNASSFPHLAGHILEAGKNPDVLFLFQRRAPPNANRAESSQWPQTRLVRLSGRDGRILWEQSLGAFGALDISNLKIFFATADLDGDGVKDIVFWLPVAAAGSPAAELQKQPTDSDVSKGKVEEPPARPLFELRAYSGRDGTLLWRRPGFYAREVAGMPVGFKLSFLREIPAPVICDPKGDGKPLVLVTDQGLDPNSSGLRPEVLALDGKSGKLNWSWCAGGVSAYQGPLESSGVWRDASPQVVRTAAGPAIVVSAFDESLRMHVDPKTKHPTPTNKSGSEIVLLSVGGKVLHKTEDESPGAQAIFVNLPPVRPRLWVHDLTGDRQDALVWYANGRVRAKRPAADKTLWEWQRPDPPAAVYGYPVDPICGIQPAGKGFPATISVATFNGIIGLAGPTGKVRWRCDAEHIEPTSVMKSDDPPGLPRIWTNAPGTMQTCHFSLAIDDRGNYVLPTPAPREYDTSFVDHRFLRPLPWVRPYNMQENWSGLWVVFVIGILAVASIIGWWPGKLTRAAWLFGLWFIAFLFIESIRFALDARELGPGEHFDWSNWWALSFQDFHIVVSVFSVIFLGWWMLRIVWWSSKKISARMRRLPLRQR